MGGDVVRLERQRGLKRLDRGVEIAGLGVSGAEIGIGAPVLWSQCDGLLELGNRAGQIRFAGERHAKPVVRVGVFGPTFTAR